MIECKTCHQIKEENEYYIHKKSCKKCSNKYVRDRRAKQLKEYQIKKEQSLLIDKECTICHQIKNGNEFRFERNSCKKCCYEYKKENTAKNLEKNIPRPSISEKKCKTCNQTKEINAFYYTRAYHIYENECKECARKKRIEYDKIHSENIKKYGIEYRRTHRENIRKRYRKYRSNKLKNDICFRLRYSFSKYINLILKKNRSSKKGESITKYLPYTFQELKEHIESQFEDWMNWDNHGIYKPSWDDNDKSTWTWQIDHIIPQSDLPFNSMDHPNFQKCWSLENLRPLSSKQNVLEGSMRTRHNHIHIHSKPE